jgi:hypothetical protein
MKPPASVVPGCSVPSMRTLPAPSNVYAGRSNVLSRTTCRSSARLETPLPERRVLGLPPVSTGNAGGRRSPRSVTRTALAAPTAREARSFQRVRRLLCFPRSIVSVPAEALVSGSVSTSGPTGMPRESIVSRCPEAT